MRSAEDEIELRQMAMLKAPVLGQLNRKPADTDKDKARRRRDSPIRKDPRRRAEAVQEPPTSPKPEEKEPSSRTKHYTDSKSRRKTREKPSRAASSQSENKPDRKRERPRAKTDRKVERRDVPEPKFSPEPESPVPEPRPAPSPPRPLSSDLEMITSSPSPEPPPPPVIGCEDDEDMVVTIEESPEQQRPEPVGFKTVKGALKSRNYSRRNKERSPSPAADVDLREAPAAPATNAGKPTGMSCIMTAQVTCFSRIFVIKILSIFNTGRYLMKMSVYPNLMSR